MTQDYDQARAHVLHPVFDAAQRMVVDQIASRANDKKVTEVLVEDQLGRSTGIGASDNDSEWVLRLGRLRPTRRRRLALGYLTRGKPKIALLEFGERSISRHRGSRMIGGQDQSGDAQADNGGEDSELGRGFHSSFLFVQGRNWNQKTQTWSNAQREHAPGA